MITIGADEQRPRDEALDLPRRDTVPATSTPPRAAPDAGPFHIGEVVGGAYHVTGVLGSGGMGIVYDAVDAGLNRPVALKVPLASELAPMMRREAQTMAAVRHPNLVAVYAVGRHRGVDYFVMERLEGATLEARLATASLEARPIPIAEVLDYLIPLADALSAVHAAGLAHRDVKLANVMVCGGRVVLTDFGLATPELDVGRSRTVGGSLDTIAPEIVCGSLRPGEGPQVDLYAVGVLAFELLTGHAPFEDERPEDVLDAHVVRRPPDVRSLRSDVPDDLARLVDELLEKSPVDRPESSEVLLWRLSAIRIALSHKPGPAPIAVLIVDDEADVGAILRRGLAWSFPGMRVEATTDPVDAMRRIERSPPDIVVVDLNMPRLNGVEMAMQIKGLPEERQPVLVAMSGDATPDDVRVLGLIGIDGFVPKDDTFVTRMCEVIGRLRHRRRAPSDPAPERPSRS
jgi:serine/threonine-protein kinase